MTAAAYALSLSEKGTALRDKIKLMFERHVRSLQQIGMGPDDMGVTNETCNAWNASGRR